MVPVISIKREYQNLLISAYVFDCLQSALGHDHVEDLSKHGSQVDAAKGFGGKFGVQKDRVDKVGHGILINTYCTSLF